MMDANQLVELRKFVEQLKSNPSILHDPSLIFFKEYLRSLGAQVPKIEKTDTDYDVKAETKPSFPPKHDDEVMESDVELKRREEQEAQEREVLVALKDGQVISVQSTSELEEKTMAAKKASRLLILYFTATWCGPCRYMSPLYTNLATKHPRVVFLKVDIDDANEVAASWNITSVPTFCFIRDGKQVDKVVGADKGLFEQKIAQNSSSK